MSDDWARKYIHVHKQKQQEQQNRQTRASLAQAGAPSMFQRILDRLRQDLQTFHTAGVLHDLKLKTEDSPEKFTVSSFSPFTRLEVELNIVLIKYEHSVLGKDQRPERHSGTLRVCSALDGNLTVYRNGDGESFADESEVSEFLLKPLLDFIDS